MFHVFTREFHSYDGAVSCTGLCRESVGTDLGCCRIGDGVPGEAEFIFGVVIDLLAAFGVLVVKNFFGA